MAGAAPPAGLAVTSLGNSSARFCYNAARERNASRQALEACHDALASTLHPRDALATYVNRGVIHAERESYDLALRDFEAATAVDPDAPEPFLNKSVLMLRMEGREGEARLLADVALAKQTKQPALAYYTRAVAHEKTGNVSAAYKDYLQAVKLAPDWDLPTQELRRFKVGR